MYHLIQHINIGQCIKHIHLYFGYKAQAETQQNASLVASVCGCECT